MGTWENKQKCIFYFPCKFCSYSGTMEIHLCICSDIEFENNWGYSLFLELFYLICDSCSCACLWDEEQSHIVSVLTEALPHLIQGCLLSCLEGVILFASLCWHVRIQSANTEDCHQRLLYKPTKPWGGVLELQASVLLVSVPSLDKLLPEGCIWKGIQHTMLAKSNPWIMKNEISMLELVSR